MRQWIFAATALVASLAGCGTAPGATTAHTMKAGPSPAPASPAVTSPAPATPGASGDMAALIADIRQVQTNLTGFTARVSVYEQGPTGNPANQTLQVAYEKPSVLHIDVLSSSEGTSGTQLLWPGGDSVKVKPGYLPFAVGLTMEDPHLASKNGWPLKDTEVNSILRVLLDSHSQVRNLGDRLLNGKPVTVVEVRSASSPKGATREVIALDRSTHLPAVRMIYKGDTLIYRLTVKQMTLVAPTSDDLAI